QKLAADQAALSRQLSRQSSVANSVPPERSAPILTPPDQAPAVATSLPAARETEAELDKVRTDRAAAEARSKVLEDQLTKVASELEALRAQNEETSVSREQLEKKLKDAEQVANAIKDDLQQIRQARSKDSLTIAAQDLEIQRLSEKLTAQAETLEQ